MNLDLTPTRSAALDLRDERRGMQEGYGFLDEKCLLLAGAILMALAWLIPWAGGVIVGLAMLVGTGAWVRSVTSRLRRRTALV